MTILIVSDLHFEKGYHHGVYEYDAYEWLLRIVKRTKPAVLLGLGDWGYAWTRDDWQELTAIVPVYGFYGNHDDLTILQAIENRDGTNLLTRDGEIKAIENLTFGFLNGIIAESKRVKQGIPRKTVQEFLKYAEKLIGVDVLCTHESPYLLEYRCRINQSVANRAALEAVRLVKPKLAISGHISGAYSVSKIEASTVLRVDSGQTTKHYAIIQGIENQVAI